MKVVATKPVSLFWQTFFAIFIDGFAFYRIQKLRRYMVIVVIPNVIIVSSISTIFTDFECEPDWWLYFIYDTCQALEIQIITNLIYGGFLVFSIYLVRKWSVEWNKKFQV